MVCLGSTHQTTSNKQALEPFLAWFHQQSNGEHLITPPWPLLADGVARHVGDPVAFIVAENINLARDAAETINVDYDPLPP